MDARKIGNAIKILRKRRGFTQCDLADAMRVTDKAVSKWERGLSIPDISVITELAQLLNVDVDNLIDGNITFLEETWQGIYRGRAEPGAVNLDTPIYGKPAVDFVLSYFMLAGIRSICFYVNDRDAAYLQGRFGNGSSLGLVLSYGAQDAPWCLCGNTMIVEGLFFLYGPNLTKYFQRAMSYPDRVTVLAANRLAGRECERMGFDNMKRVTAPGPNACHYRMPILFVPEKFREQMRQSAPVRALQERQMLYAELMGRGMVDCALDNPDDVADVADFIRFIQRRTGYRLYEPEQVAKNRGLI